MVTALSKASYDAWQLYLGKLRRVTTMSKASYSAASCIANNYRVWYKGDALRRHGVSYAECVLIATRVRVIVVCVDVCVQLMGGAQPECPMVSGSGRRSKGARTPCGRMYYMPRHVQASQVRADTDHCCNAGARDPSCRHAHAQAHNRPKLSERARTRGLPPCGRMYYAMPRPSVSGAARLVRSYQAAGTRTHNCALGRHPAASTGVDPVPGFGFAFVWHA